MEPVEMQIEQMVDAPYETVVKRDTCDGQPCFVAYNPELEGCMAQGFTWEEAVQNLKEVRRSYISLMVRRGWEVPEPKFTPKPIILRLYQFGRGGKVTEQHIAA